MEKFTHIESFYHIVKYVDKVNADDVPKEYRIRNPVRFRGTVKLHGTNSGVACKKRELQAQSRNRIIDVTNDNLEFTKFVVGEEQTKAIREIEADIRDIFKIPEETIVTLYGEWVGPGIQQATALNKLPKRQWVLFAVKSGDQYLDAVPSLGDRYAEARIFSIVDVDKFDLTVDFNDSESKQAALDQATEWTNKVEEQCPWGAKFGCEGIGEGIVWTPIGPHFGRTDLYWKSKGLKHKVVAKKKPKSLDPEVINNVREFVDYAVTEARLLQGMDYLREMNLPTDSMRSTGDFLRWIGQDISRECEQELEDNHLKWKQVAGAINAKAKDWFKAQVETI